MTIADNLTLLNSTKQDIKAAIEAKGVDMTDVAFTDYDTKIGEITTGGTIPIVPSYTPWTRNSEWLTLPTVEATDPEQIIMLVRVDNTTYNELFFSAAGAYTVDWGDGTVTNYASGAFAYRNYDYNNAALNGTLTSDGYKQAICKITLQTPGATFSSIVFNTTTGRVSSSITIPVLDMIFHSRNPTGAFSLGGLSTGVTFRICERIEFVTYDRTSGSTLLSNFTNLQSIVLRNNAFNNITTAVDMFNACASLKEIPSFNASNIVSANTMFGNCYSLVNLGSLTFGPNLDASSMFAGCSSILDLRNINLNSPTTLVSTFSDCSSLMYPPVFNNMSGVTSYNATFNACGSLLEVPSNLATSNAISVSSIFNNCGSLNSVPAMNLSSVGVNGALNLFNGCTSLQSIGTLTFTNVQNASNMFNTCRSLDVPNFTISIPAATTTSGMFTNASALERITFSSTSAISQCSSMFQGASSLKKLTITAPFTNVSAIASMFSGCINLMEVDIATFTTNGSVSTSSMFTNCFNLRRIILGGFNQTFTIAGCSLGAAELNALYTSLGTVTGKTITVTGNPGTATDNPAIATAKGWTVVG